MRGVLESILEMGKEGLWNKKDEKNNSFFFSAVFYTSGWPVTFLIWSWDEPHIRTVTSSPENFGCFISFQCQWLLSAMMYIHPPSFMQRRLYWDYMFTGVFSPRPLGECPRKWSSPLALYIQSFALEASVRIHLDDQILKKNARS